LRNALELSKNLKMLFDTGEHRAPDRLSSVDFMISESSGVIEAVQVDRKHVVRGIRIHDGKPFLDTVAPIDLVAMR
jgi:hypothetical protein